MSDLIDRQAAIDALTHKWNGMVTSVFDVINSMPSAQPEIIFCKDCKHWEQESICEGYCSEIEKGGFDEDHFCSFAERRTDEADYRKE